MEDLFGRLKEGGFKLTPQRIAIAKYLEGNKSHPTAARIYDDLKSLYPSMSMATVYNTLSTMRSLGLVQELNLQKDQIHYDPDMKSHHHFICSDCKSVIDVFEKASLPSFSGFKKETKNRVDHVSLVLTGLCESCLLTGDSLC